MCVCVCGSVYVCSVCVGGWGLCAVFNFLVFRWNKFLHDESIMRVGCGLKHTVILLDDGTMYSCGSNEKGQLGQDHSSTRYMYTLIC